jgi:hypothetical protein
MNINLDRWFGIYIEIMSGHVVAYRSIAFHKIISQRSTMRLFSGDDS